MPIVHEFIDVFPKELPCLPPEREIKFYIYIIPGTDPISISPTELKELKEQL